MTKNFSLIRRSENRAAARKPRTSSVGSDNDASTSQEAEYSGGGNGNETKVHSTPSIRSKLYQSLAAHDNAWTPSVSTMFKVIISLRLSAAFWSPISDCDEVYNYWEPLHQLLYRSGFQTWEYSPQYAVRSYLYIGLHWLMVRPFQYLLPSSKFSVFFFVRCSLAAITGCSELVLYCAIRARLGNAIARYYILFSGTAAGMFICSSAFLPSTFAMNCCAFALAAYLYNQCFVSVFVVAVSALVGWPFSAVLGLPVLIHMNAVNPTQYVRFVCYSIISGISLCCLLMGVDSYFYGKIVLAPYNIIAYNLLTEHGPNIYGTEPASYYLVNLALNWNVAFVLSLVTIPVTLSACRLTTGGTSHLSVMSRALPAVLVNVSMLLWLGIFLLQPHKEERFLFPIYPFLALSAALTVHAMERLAVHYRPKLTSYIHGVICVVLAVFVLAALTRSAAQYRNYHAPLDVYMKANEHITNKLIEQKWDKHNTMHNVDSNGLKPLNLCVGKEWYRFPSSFFLPQPFNGTRTTLKFIKSEFAGLLPQPFEEMSTLINETRFVPANNNDANKEQLDRYVTVAECDYLMDLEQMGPDQTTLEPNYAEDTLKWQRVYSERFLLSQHSNQLARAFYIPALTERYCTFGLYTLLERIR